MTAQLKPKMTVEEFIPWAMAQTSGRYELVQGEIVAMAPERAAHNRAKIAVFKALEAAVKRAGLPCEVFTDGMSVRVDRHNLREPDASIQCGKAVAPDQIVLDQPLLVVEVVSPSCERSDSGAKLAEYFGIISIKHYLILDPHKRVLIHHARGKDGAIETRVHTSGSIVLDPPGFELSVADVLGENI